MHLHLLPAIEKVKMLMKSELNKRDPNKSKPNKSEYDNSSVKTKKDKANHGFGLINIKETAEKYGGECYLTSYKEKENYYFKLEIILPVE